MTETSAALEQSAVAQRQRIACKVDELSNSVRECLNVERTAKKHLVGISLGAAALAVIVGYGVAGFFGD